MSDDQPVPILQDLVSRPPGVQPRQETPLARSPSPTKTSVPNGDHVANGHYPISDDHMTNGGHMTNGDHLVDGQDKKRKTLTFADDQQRSVLKCTG